MTHSLLPDALLVAGVAALFGLLLLGLESGVWLARAWWRARTRAKG